MTTDSNGASEDRRGQRTGRLAIARRWVLRGLLVALAAGLLYGGVLGYRIALLGSAYTAKLLCSGVFVSGRPADDVLNIDVLADRIPIVHLFSGSVDRASKTAEGNLYGLARQEAVYVPGYGCTLTLGEPVNGLRALAATRRWLAGEPEGAAPWPGGMGVTAGNSEVDAKRLGEVIEAAFDDPDPTRAKRARAVVVVHKGRLVAERYADGIEPSMPLIGWSLAKSAANALAGVLVNEGKLATDQTSLLPLWSASDDPRAEISLDDLLRMQSGLSFDENYEDLLSDILYMLFRARDAGGFAAAKPLSHAPGTHWHYSSGTTNIIMRVLQGLYTDKAQGRALPFDKLFKPLGMRTAVLELDTDGTGVPSTFMYASARDWARLGLLFANNGVWNGQRLWPEWWLRYSLTPASADRLKEYGAHLWLKIPYPVRSPASAGVKLPEDAFFMLGHEGQFVAVVPSYDLVVVRLGVSRIQGVWRPDAFLERVLTAFRPTARSSTLRPR